MDANIDDMTGEQLGYIMELLLEAGAFDVYFTHIQMKKNRPGVKLSVICDVRKQKELSELLLKHTSTFGVRYKVMDRDILDREFIEVRLQHGTVRCKLGKLDGVLLKVQPEYEDCKKIAKEQALPLASIFNEVLEEASKIEKNSD